MDAVRVDRRGGARWSVWTEREGQGRRLDRGCEVGYQTLAISCANIYCGPKAVLSCI